MLEFYHDNHSMQQLVKVHGCPVLFIGAGEELSKREQKRLMKESKKKKGKKSIGDDKKDSQIINAGDNLLKLNSESLITSLKKKQKKRKRVRRMRGGGEDTHGRNNLLQVRSHEQRVNNYRSVSIDMIQGLSGRQVD